MTASPEQLTEYNNLILHNPRFDCQRATLFHLYVVLPFPALPRAATVPFGR